MHSCVTHCNPPFPNSWQSISCLHHFFFKFQIILLLTHNKSFFLSSQKIFFQKATRKKKTIFSRKKKQKSSSSTLMASSQWTMPKLVTWRVKDWASCFLASKFPLGRSLFSSSHNLNICFYIIV